MCPGCGEPIPIPEADRAGPTVLRIAGYDYAVPAWWDSVEAPEPEFLTTQDAVGAFVKRHCGAETGSASTWREALKIWAGWCQQHGHFPVYLAHCHKAGGELTRAAEIYGDLYRLADSQPGKRAWFRCYLAHAAGECYAELRDFAKARRWHSRAAEYAKHEDSAVRFYGEAAARKLVSLPDR